MKCLVALSAHTKKKARAMTVVIVSLEDGVILKT